jgi:predicted transcriptional regulator
MPKKPHSGSYIPDEQRSTVKLTMRLPPETVDEIRMLAEAWKKPMSAVVTAAVEGLRRPQATGDQASGKRREEKGR